MSKLKTLSSAENAIPSLQITLDKQHSVGKPLGIYKCFEKKQTTNFGCTLINYQCHCIIDLKGGKNCTMTSIFCFINVTDKDD